MQNRPRLPNVKHLNVHIGQIKIARKGETLRALLGSCIGVGLIRRAKKICGLAHCLLPKNPMTSFSIDGRHVSQAIPSLLALMKVRPENYHEIEAVVAGGGNMTNPGRPVEDLVGSQNTQVALAELKKLSIQLLNIDVGGNEGRQMTINGHDYTYKIETIPRIEGVG